MLAIVGGRPKVLNLLELVESFVEFRRDVVRRRTEFELRKAEARYHILEGLEDRARSPRCGDHADSRLEDRRRGARRLDGRSSACRRSSRRRSWTCSSSG